MATGVRGLFPISGNVFFRHAKDAYQRIPDEPTQTTAGHKEALTSIVFAATALEAFINELADIATQPLFPDKQPEPPLPAFAGLIEELERSRASITSKFWLGKWVLSATPDDKGAQPYQDFALLIDLRNALIHVRALDKADLDSDTGAWIRNVDAPTIISKLISKRILAQFTETEVAWTTLLTTKATGRWACDAASAIVLSVLDSLPNGPYSEFIGRLYRSQFSPAK